MRKRFEIRMAYTRQSHPRTVIGREPSCGCVSGAVVARGSQKARLQVSPSAMTAPDRENQMPPGQYVARC
jgi:hypothetical protein